MRYLRSGKDASPYLFVGQKGQLTRSGALQMVKRVFRAHGIEGISPHDLRHTFAMTYMDSNDARVEDMMEVGGWKSDSVARYYAKHSQKRRAIRASRKHLPGAKLERSA